MIPSPTELTYFIAIVNSLNFTHAARRLGVSQPSLSQTIKKLEEMLGAPLFIRHKKGVTLTPAGEQLLVQVKPLLAHWDKTKELVLQSHQEIYGRVTIGCRSTVAVEMSAFIKYLLVKHPHIEIHFNFQNSLDTTESVINSAVDIGIVVNPLEHPDLIMHKIAETKMAFWVGPGKSDIQDIYSGKAIIICEPNLPQSKKLIRELEDSHINIQRMITANSMEAVAQFTIDGCGIGIIPSCFATLLGADKLTLLENMPNCPNHAYIIYRQENRNVEVIKTIIYALKEFAKIRL